MGKEKLKTGAKVVKPKISGWKLRQTEKELFAEADDLPNWRLADKSRRSLADLSVQFSAQMPSTDGLGLKDLGPSEARQWAVIAASGIVVRSVGTGMAMVASGYLPETAASIRRIVEAALNTQAILEDQGGAYALRFLRGRPSKLSTLASKYEASEDVRLLSVASHADVRGLVSLTKEPPRGIGDLMESEVSLLPSRDSRLAHDLLYAMAYECGTLSAALAEAFGVAVEILPWVSGELLRAREALDRRMSGNDGENG